MLQSVEGIYGDGKVELQETLDGMDGVRVIVTLSSQKSPVPV